MAVERILLDLPMKASVNASSGIAQFAPVVLDTAGGSGPFDVIPATTANAPVIGINQDMGDQLTVNSTTPPNVAAGESLNVRVLGVSKALAGGAINAGQYVAVNGSSQLIAVTSLNPATTPTNTYVVGIALTPATQAGDLISVLLLPGLATLVTS